MRGAQRSAAVVVFLPGVIAKGVSALDREDALERLTAGGKSGS